MNNRSETMSNMMSIISNRVIGVFEGVAIAVTILLILWLYQTFEDARPASKGEIGHAIQSARSAGALDVMQQCLLQANESDGSAHLLRRLDVATCLDRVRTDVDVINQETAVQAMAWRAKSAH